jgi:hypothetical protein
MKNKLNFAGFCAFSDGMKVIFIALTSSIDERFAVFRG